MYHPGNAQQANVWPQCWDLQGRRGLEQRNLRNLNLGDLKKGPNGGVSPTPQNKNKVPVLYAKISYFKAAVTYLEVMPMNVFSSLTKIILWGLYFFFRHFIIQYQPDS
jgi:hypothetical protein